MAPLLLWGGQGGGGCSRQIQSWFGRTRIDPYLPLYSPAYGRQNHCLTTI